MQLCEIEVPGLRGPASIELARTELRRCFPGVVGVLAATRRRTIVVIFEGDEALEEWAIVLDRALRARRRRAWRLAPLGRPVALGRRE